MSEYRHPDYPAVGRETVLGLTPLGCAGLIAIPIVLIVGLVVWTVFFDSDLEPRLATGNPARLDGGGGGVVVVDDRAFPELFRELRSAKTAYDELVRRGSAVEVDDGTLVRVIDFRVSFVRVRIESGARQGETGWAPEENLRPIDTSP